MHGYPFALAVRRPASPRGGLRAPRARLAGLASVLTLAVSLVVAISGARAGVVDMNALGQPQVASKPPSRGVVARLKLIPQGLRAMLRAGLAVRITSNIRADGILTLSVSRAEAKRAHFKAGPGPALVVGRGTISGVKSGTVTLHLRFSRTIAAKLRRLGHVTLTVRLVLFGAAGQRIAVDVAGHYL